MTTLKEVFDKKINQEEIYESIIYRNNHFNLKPVLSFACILLIASFLFKPTNEIKMDENIISINNINESEFVSADLYVKISDSLSYNSNIMYSKYPFLKELENYKNYEWDIYYMYVNEENSNDYSLLHDIVFTLKDGDSMIEIAFSEIGKPLSCIVIEPIKKDLSIINNVEMILQGFNDSYYVTFKHNGIYYDIEANNTRLEELIEVLEIITK